MSRINVGGEDSKEMKDLLMRFWKEEDGQDLVEYALLAALLGLSSIAALNSVANLLTTAFTNAVANMSPMA